MELGRLYRFKHKTSNTVYYGYGSSPREASFELIEIIYKKPNRASTAFIVERYNYLKQVGLISLRGRPSFSMEDWEVSKICRTISRNDYLSIVYEFAAQASPSARVLNVSKELRKAMLR